RAAKRGPDGASRLWTHEACTGGSRVMDLLLIRHADAAPKNVAARPIARDAVRLLDASRPLTKHGRARLWRTVHGLERLSVSFDRIYHSPKLRSTETADALSSLL